MSEFEKQLNNQQYEKELQTNILLSNKLKETEENLNKYKTAAEQLQNQLEFIKMRYLQVCEALANKSINFDNLLEQFNQLKNNK